MVAAINSYGERTNRTETKKRKPYSPYYYKWTPAMITELYRYFGILLFMGLR